MRYTEVAEMEIYLRDDPKAGLVFRGEISGCKPGRFVDLGQILLQYAMSCEECREQSVAKEIWPPALNTRLLFRSQVKRWPPLLWKSRITSPQVGSPLKI